MDSSSNHVEPGSTTAPYIGENTTRLLVHSVKRYASARHAGSDFERDGNAV
jgi:hypothetical protein